MVSVESKIFDTVSNALPSNVSAYGEYVDTPVSFPTVCIVESDNYVVKSHMDSSKCENLTKIVYTVNIYTNGSTKKADCKSLANLVDETMQSLNLVRLSLNQIPNEDRSIYRMVMRFEGYISETDTDKFHIYRR